MSFDGSPVLGGRAISEPKQLDSKEKMTYTEQAAKRKHCQRLTRLGTCLLSACCAPSIENPLMKQACVVCFSGMNSIFKTIPGNMLIMFVILQLYTTMRLPCHHYATQDVCFFSRSFVRYT